MSFRALLVMTCGASLIALVGCDHMEAFSGVSEDFHMSYEMAPGGHLDLKNQNGSVEITGWDRNTVDVAGTKYAPEQGSLKDVRIEIHQSNNTLTVRTIVPQQTWHMGGGYSAKYRLHVPRRFVLDRLETTNGTISAEDLEGGGHLESTNGRVSFERLDGEYRVETTNGSIGGTIHSGSVIAETTNGSLEVNVAKTEARKPIRLSTTNGGITLKLPKGVDGELHATTTNGKITNELAGTEQEKSKHELRAQLGSGGQPIEATTTNGSIHIAEY